MAESKPKLVRSGEVIGTSLRPPSKAAKSAELEADVQRFLKSGRSVENVPIGVSGEVKVKGRKRQLTLKSQARVHRENALKGVRKREAARQASKPDPIPLDLVEDVRIECLLADVAVSDGAVRSKGIDEAQRLARMRLNAAVLEKLGAPREQIAEALGLSAKYIGDYLRRVTELEQMQADRIARKHRRRVE